METTVHQTGTVQIRTPPRSSLHNKGKESASHTYLHHLQIRGFAESEGSVGQQQRQRHLGDHVVDEVAQQDGPQEADGNTERWAPERQPSRELNHLVDMATVPFQVLCFVIDVR